MSPSGLSFPGFISFLTTTGNVKEIATGQIIGAGITRASTSLIDDVLGPALAYVTKGSTLDTHFIVLRRGARYPYATSAEADADGAVTVKYGKTAYAIFNLLVQAFLVYMIIGAWKRCVGDSCSWRRK